MPDILWAFLAILGVWAVLALLVSVIIGSGMRAMSRDLDNWLGDD
jgi:hypothetical protein